MMMLMGCHQCKNEKLPRAALGDRFLGADDDRVEGHLPVIKKFSGDSDVNLNPNGKSMMH